MHSLLFSYSSNRPHLTRPQHERIIQLSSHILKVLGRVDPGFTQWKGSILSELVSSLVTISKEDVKAGFITADMFKRRLFNAMVNLRTAKKCLHQGFSRGTGGETGH